MSSDCPGTIAPPSFSNGQPQAAVAAGKTAAATLSLSPDGTLLSPNSKSPARCTVVLQATTEVPANSEENSSKNTTRLIVDVVDKNDF